MALISHKMLVVAVAAGFCGFLLRSAVTPSVSAPVTSLSAVAPDVDSARAELSGWEGKLRDSAANLLGNLAFKPETKPADGEFPESAELITLPDAETPETSIAVSRAAAGLPELADAAAMEETPEIAINAVRVPVAARAVSARAVSRPAKTRRYREVWATVTAYCPCTRCCGSQARGRTSLGGTAWIPGIAADPQALAYGTAVFVPGYGEYTVDDTGGAMRRSWRHGRLHIDIRMKFHDQARQWGRRTMKIRIYK